MVETAVTARSIERSGIQGLVARGYDTLTYGRYVLLAFGDPTRGRAFVGTLEIDDAVVKPSSRAVNVAFTYAGLERLGLDEEALDGLAVELREGMVTSHRSRQLGDHGASDPKEWAWGRDPASIHVLLIIFTANAAEMNRVCADLEGHWLAHDMVHVATIETEALRDAREHFGFRDGMAQPRISGLHAEGRGRNVIAPGEFLLGYVNEYGRIAAGPQLRRDSGHLADLAGTSDRDFGKDGTYLVVRQLRQHVASFWRFVARAVESTDFAAAFGTTPDPRIRFAAKMVGRWPGGAPLVLSPDYDDPTKASDDDFGYADRDPDGRLCPFGAHIRRTNPRDWHLADKPDEADRIARRHRILRRGRAYGKPLVADMDVTKLLDAHDDGEERGLLFVCINANIGRQFEFIQHTWVNSPKFADLYEDADPIMGDHSPDVPHPLSNPSFTIPTGGPYALRATGIERFVDVRGGAYFFMPSLRAIRYLAVPQA